MSVFFKTLDKTRVRNAIECNTQGASSPERAPKIKTPVTVRIEAGLLAELRLLAREENRTLTNLIETVLQQRLARPVARPETPPAHSARRIKDKPTNAA